jgi:hypothetical protein
MDAAVVSVIASAIVAVAALLIPLLTALVGDSLKWRQERRLAREEKLEKSTLELLNRLADFWTGDPSYASAARQDKSYHDVLNRFYSWETAIWSFCKEAERQQVTQLRSRIIQTPIRELDPATATEYADEILTLARQVRQR